MDRFYSDGKYQPWRSISAVSSKLIDGGNPNDFTYLSAKLSNNSDGIAPQLAYVRMMNRSGGAITVGLGARISKSLWRAGQWTNGTTTFTDDTTAFQDSNTTDGALETTTNSDGYVVLCKEKFNAISLLIQTASTGSPVRTIEYSTAGGTWAAAGTAHTFNSSTNYPATGAEAILWIDTPDDWALTEVAHGTNIPTGYYALRVRATTAPTVAGTARSITVHRVYFSTPNIANNAAFEVNFGGMYFPLTENCDGLSMVTNVASNRNNITALVRFRGL